MKVALVRPLLSLRGMKNLVVALVLATAGTAAAQPAETPAQPAPTVPTASEWYGWQIMAADAATFTLAGVSENGVIALGWVGSGAVVHAAHGHTARAVGSVAMRTAFPLLGVALGAASASGCDHGDGESWCAVGPAIAGGLIGMGAAEIIDLVDAKDEVAIGPVKTSRWQPVASVHHSSATFGVAARF